MEITDEQTKAYFDAIPDVVEKIGLEGGWEPIIKEACRLAGIPCKEVALFREWLRRPAGYEKCGGRLKAQVSAAERG